MKRFSLTARNLRLLQIGILAVICLSLVAVAVAGGRCSSDERSEDREEEASGARFHAATLQAAFTDAGFAADGNLYAYTLTPPDGTNLAIEVQLLTEDARNDTVEISFLAVSGVEGDGDIVQALREAADAARVWQEALLAALTDAMTEADAGVAPAGVNGLRDGVLQSIESRKAFHLEAGAFAVDAGYTAPASPNLYVLRVKAVPLEAP